MKSWFSKKEVDWKVNKKGSMVTNTIFYFFQPPQMMCCKLGYTNMLAMGYLLVSAVGDNGDIGGIGGNLS